MSAPTTPTDAAASPAPVNVADLVRRSAHTRPDHPALIHPGGTVTWAELDREVDQVTAAVLAQGGAPGDRVALQLGNTPEFVTAYFGTLRAGRVAVPVNTGYTARELGHVLDDSAAVLLVTTRSGAATAAELAGRPDAAPLTVVVTGDAPVPGGLTFAEFRAGAGPSRPDPAERGRSGGEDLAVVLYTSGTSGRPRGAMLSHRALLANLEQCARIDPAVVAPDDVVLLVLPLTHVYGLNGALGMVAWHGATGVLVERFDPVETVAEIRRRGVTNVVGAPPMFVAWSLLPDVGEAFSSVRLAVSGAAPLPAAVLHRFLDATGHHIFEGYGMTETAPVLTSTLMSEVAKPDSIGRPVPGVELRLLDRAGREVAAEDPGEIVVRGANVFSGYWPDGADGPDRDGWFATGDVAYADSEGDLHLVDRRRELILVSGFNVYPREVEDVLATHPDIAESAVLGIPHPYTGESVKAMVVLRPGAGLTADDVISHCALSLARFKCPTAVEFLPDLPHSATGKVSKGRLREAAQAPEAGPAKDPAPPR